MGEQKSAPAGPAERDDSSTPPSNRLGAAQPGMRRPGGRERRAYGEARYRMLVEHGRDLISLHDVDGRYRYVTPAIHRMLGYTPAEMVGADYAAFLHPEDVPEIRSKLDRLVTEGEVQEAVRCRFRSKGGSWVWLESLGVPLREDPRDPNRVTAVMASSRNVTAAVEAAHQLATSEERLRLAVRTARLGIYDIDMPARTGHYSDEYLRIFGYEPQDRPMFNLGWEPLVHPEDAPTLSFLRERVRRGELEYLNHESRRMHRDGRWVWVRIVGRALDHDARGRPARLISVLQDIDQRKRDEFALEEGRARLREAQAMARLGDWRVDTSTMAHRWSDEAFHVLGYLPGECEPSLQSFLARVHPDDVERMTAVARQLEQAPADTREDTRIVMPDGSLRDIHLQIRVSRDARGLVRGLTGTVQDVTERKAVEAALRSTAADLAKAQHIARVGSWRWTAADGSVQWSPEMFRILGLDPSGRPVPYHEHDRIFLPASWSRLQDARQAALVHGTPYEVELEGRRGDGSIGWFMARGEVARDGAGRTTGIFGTLQDITDHKRAEAEMRTVRDQLRELSSHHEDVLNEERKSIALDVHDELGQMLTAMKLQLDLLQSQLNDPRAAAAAADKLRALIGDTIEVTRNVALNLRPAALDFGLVPALEWLAEDFTLRSELPCSIDACAGEVILGEKAAIELFRIAQESLTNVARHAGATRVLLTMQRLDDRLCLSIRDDGCGFGPQDVDRIGHFGLLGMRERALRLGAELRVDSQPGRGTTVSVLLPARPGGQEPFDRESP